MFSSEKYNLIVVLGPTASGKTSFAAKLAYAVGGEIISADSRQVYRGMTIGTGKDLDDYIVNGERIRYHLIDIVDPGYKFNLFEYQTAFFESFEDISKRHKMPVLCGGTGLYIESVLKDYKMVYVPVNTELRKSLEGRSLDELTEILKGFKKLHNKTDTDTVKRAIRGIEIETYYRDHPEIVPDHPKIKPLIIGINIDRELRREKITDRLKKRLEEGMIDEVRGLLKKGLSPDDLIYYGLEYKFVTLYLTGELTYDEMFDKLNTAIHRFAKRQMTWFRGMERKGFDINWIDAQISDEAKVDMVLEML